jgi:hypothetical protein
LVVEETYAVSRPVAAALGGAPMLRRLSPRWLIPLTLVVLLLPSCSDTADDSTDTTLADDSTDTTLAPTTTTAGAEPEATTPPTTEQMSPAAKFEQLQQVAAAVTKKDLVYATTREEGTLTLDMYAPVESAGAPIVIYLLGTGDPGAPKLVDGLIEEGTIVFVAWPAGYGGGPEQILSDHGANIRAMADSIACAIRFAREQASERDSTDPVVVLTGLGGAGGVAAHAALFGATLEARWDEYAAEGGPPRQVECEVTEGSTHVDALVGMAGAYDVFVPIYGETMWGRAYQQEHDPELWEFLSSSIGANPNLTIRLIHGTTDGSFPYENSAEFAALLTDADYDVQLATFDGGHSVPPTDLYSSTIKEVLDDQ